MIAVPTRAFFTFTGFPSRGPPLDPKRKEMAVKSLRLINLPIVAFAMMATLTGCGDTTSPTALSSDIDTTPPPAPAGMNVSYDAGGPTRLDWDASAAPDVIGYQVYVYSPSPERDNAYVLANDADGSDTSFQIPAVEGNSQVVYRIRAVDAAGNHSAFSSSVTVQYQGASGGGGIEPTLVDPS